MTVRAFLWRSRPGWIKVFFASLWDSLSFKSCKYLKYPYLFPPPFFPVYGISTRGNRQNISAVCGMVNQCEDLEYRTVLYRMCDVLKMAFPAPEGKEIIPWTLFPDLSIWTTDVTAVGLNSIWQGIVLFNSSNWSMLFQLGPIGLLRTPPDLPCLTEVVRAIAYYCTGGLGSSFQWVSSSSCLFLLFPTNFYLFAPPVLVFPFDTRFALQYIY